MAQFAEAGSRLEGYFAATRSDRVVTTPFRSGTDLTIPGALLTRIDSTPT